MLNKDEDDDLEGGVIYSNNISEVDSDYYNNFTEQKADNNENYDINKSSQNKKIQLELTSMSNSETNSSEFNDIMQEEKLDDNENNINTPIIEKEKEVKSDSEDKEETLLYGNEDGSGHKRNYYLKMTQSGLHKKLLPNYLVKISKP